MRGYWINIKGIIKRAWYWFIISIFLFSVGIIITIIGNSTLNPIIMFFGVVFMGGGVYLFVNKTKGSNVRIIGEGKITEDIEQTALIISPRTIRFQPVQEKEAQGFALKNLNDRLYYHVLYQKNDGLEEFLITDDEPQKRYYSPGEMANVVMMASYKKAINYSSSNIQVIPVAIFAGVIVIEIIGLVAMG